MRQAPIDGFLTPQRLTQALNSGGQKAGRPAQHMALVNLGLTAYQAGDLDAAEAHQRTTLVIAEHHHGATLPPAQALALALQEPPAQRRADSR